MVKCFIKLTQVSLQSNLSEYSEIASEWRIVFFVAAAMYVLGSITYWFLGSAEVQSWSKFDQDESDVEVTDIPIKAYESSENNERIR